MTSRAHEARRYFAVVVAKGAGSLRVEMTVDVDKTFLGATIVPNVTPFWWRDQGLVTLKSGRLFNDGVVLSVGLKSDIDVCGDCGLSRAVHEGARRLPEACGAFREKEARSG